MDAGHYESMHDQSNVTNETFTRGPIVSRQIGLGTAIATVTRTLGFKSCGGCKKRAIALDKLIPNINPMARSGAATHPSTLDNSPKSN